MTQELNTQDVVSAAFELTEMYLEEIRSTFFHTNQMDVIHEARMMLYPIIANYVGQDREVDDLSLIKNVFQKTMGPNAGKTANKAIVVELGHLTDAFIKSEEGKQFVKQILQLNSELKMQEKDVKETLQSCAVGLFLHNECPSMGRRMVRGLSMLITKSDEIIRNMDYQHMALLWRNHLTKVLGQSEQYLQSMEHSIVSGFQHEDQAHVLPVNGSSVLMKRSSSDAGDQEIVDIETRPNQEGSTSMADFADRPIVTRSQSAGRRIP